jgi:hypothetical protein
MLGVRLNPCIKLVMLFKVELKADIPLNDMAIIISFRFCYIDVIGLTSSWD